MINGDLSNWILLGTIAALAVYSSLIILFSRRWYQNQYVNNHDDDVIKIGKDYPSPILTIIRRFFKLILYYYPRIKKHQFTVKIKVIGLAILKFFAYGLLKEIKNLIKRSIVYLKVVNQKIKKALNLGWKIIKRIIETSTITLLKKICFLGGIITSIMKKSFDNVNSFDHRVHFKISSVVEICLIIIWAIFVGRNCLNFTPNRVLFGEEFSLVIQSHFTWTILPECGDCVLWNGFINGGAPAFVDTHGAVLHPVVVICTLLFGVSKGAQIVLIYSLALAGIAQWWLARVMGLGRFARLWAAFLVIVGGHLAGKMESGNVILVLSTASASFVLPPLFDLVHTRRRSSLIWTGLSLALWIVSGQGYIQIGLALAVLPAFTLFLFDRNLHLKPVAKDVAIAFLLGVLLAGIFLVPLIHILPETYKDTNPGLTNNQPLEYIPLNLVIHDPAFFYTSILGRDAYLFTNYIFIGWFPVFFAIVAIPLLWRKKVKTVLFFIISITQVFLLSSKEFFSIVVPIFPLFSAIRWGSIISGLSVPLVIGLAAAGIDHIIHAQWWPIFEFGFKGFQKKSLSLVYVLFILPSIACISTPYQQNRVWLNDYPYELNLNVINEMKTSSSQWIQHDIQKHLWTKILLENGFKLTNTWRPWFWKDHESPFPYKSFANKFENLDHKDVYAVYDEIEVMIHKNNQYSNVISNEITTPCFSKATGGLITVNCSNTEPGTLVVQENQWDGWTVKIDGTPAELLPGRFLSVLAPSGSHLYEFRYKPWDVRIGMALTFLGIILAIYIYFFFPGEYN